VFADNATIVRDYRTPWEVVTTDPDGHQTRRVFDGMGTLLRSGVRDRSSGSWYETIYGYQRGFPTLVRYCGTNAACVAGTAGGPAVLYTYDFRGNLIQTNDPDRGGTAYTYDAGGRLTDEKDSIGNGTHYTYDSANRPLTMTARYGAAGAKTYSWTYDEVRTGYKNYGRVTTIDDGDGDKTVLNYDAAGRLLNMTRTIDGVAYPFSYSYYDQGGWLRGERFPDGDVFGDDPSTSAIEPSIEYQQGRLTKIPSVLGMITYTPWGAVNRLYREDGSTGAATYTYDPARTWLQAVSTSECTRTYTRTPSGRLSAMQESGSHSINPCNSHADYTASDVGLTSYTTTPWNGLPAEQTIDYTARFDGNIGSLETIGNYQYHPTRIHFAVTAGARAYGSDLSGNMSSGNGYQFKYDGLNRLIGITGPAAFRAYYGANGRRKKVESGGTTTIYVTDDYEITNGIATKYIRVNGQVIAKKIGVGVGGVTRIESMESVTAGQNALPPGWPAGTNSDTTTPVNWHVSSRRSTGGSNALHYGNDTTNNYLGAGPNSGEVDTQTLSLPSGAANYGLSVDVFADTRSGNAVDLYSLEVRSRAAGVLGTISKASLGDGNTGGAFRNYLFPLPASVAGKNDLFVRLTFRTVDRAPNGSEGVYVDNLQLTADAGVYWLLSDAMGSIFSIEDARGRAVKRTVFAPHGAIRNGFSSGPHRESRGFAAQRHDTVGGLTLLFDGTRYLDPGIGRYLTPSRGISTAATASLNNYAFAGNDPVVNIVNPLAGSAEMIAALNLASRPSQDVTVSLAQEQIASSAMYGWFRGPTVVTTRGDTFKFDPKLDYSARTDANDLFHRNEIGRKGDESHTYPDRDGNGKWGGSEEGNSYMSALARDVPLMNFFASEHDTDSNWASLGIDFPYRDYADNFPLQFAIGVGAGAMLPAHPSLIVNSALKYSMGMTREEGLAFDVATGNAPAILAAGTDVVLGGNEDLANAAAFLLIPHNAIATTINAIRDYIRWW
jgi:RHS repeat-associated protein